MAPHEVVGPEGFVPQGDPTRRTIPEVLRHRMLVDGDKPFLSFCGEHYSYADLWAMAARVAAGLQGLGVAKGDRVALLMGNSPDFLACWFGITLAGAVEVPLNTAHRGDLLAHMLGVSDCTVVIADAAFVEAVSALRPRLPSLRHVVARGGDARLVEGRRDGIAHHSLGRLTDNAGAFTDPGVSWSDPYAVMFTSGTTGPSKGAVMPHNYAVRMGEICAAAVAYGPDDCLYNALPLFHGNAQVLSTIPALLSGARMVLAERFSAGGFWDDVRRHGCTEFNYIGTILSVLLKAEPGTADRDHPVRVMLGAGAGPGVFEAFERRFGVTLIEGYGMSEIGLPLISASNHRRPGSCGRPVEDYDIRLVDAAGRPVADGVAGELLIRPRHPHIMMQEYCAMPERTVEAWRDLWFHTGDALVRDPDGFYRFVDRKKDALRRRGENISSFEVERTVNAFAAVQESAAIPVPSELGEDEVMICVVPRADHRLSVPALIEHCRAGMADFMVPRFVRVMEALPKTPTERVEKYKLRAEGVTDDTFDMQSVRNNQ